MKKKSWLIGFEQNLPQQAELGYESKNLNDYSHTDNSIAGNLAGLKPALDTLNTYSLAAECTTTRFFQPPFLNLNLRDLGRLKFQYLEKRPIQRDKTEVEENEREDISEVFLGYEDALLFQPDCSEVASAHNTKQGLATTDLSRDIVAECERLRSETQARHLDAVEKLSWLENEQKFFARIVKRVDFWIADFETWLLDARQMKNIFERIANKPKKK